MAEEVYIIDPDVWKGSVDDPRCHVAICDVWEKPNRIIALDGGQVEMEYLDLLETPSFQDALRKLLQDIFNQRMRSPKIKTLEPQYPDGLATKVQEWGCGTPVEPVLIGMAAANTHARTKLLLVGTDRLRCRGLHNPDNVNRLRSFFRNQLRRGLEVVLASDIGLPRRDESVHGYERRTLEDETRTIFMNRIYLQFGQLPGSRKPTPGEVQNYRDTTGQVAGEVDVYLYVDKPDSRYVWVCECELREVGNEGQPTTKEKVSKLRKKVEAVEVFEKSQTSSVIVKGYIVTNAEKPSLDAEKVMEECGFQFCRVTMPKKWSTDYRWVLSLDNVSPFDL